jgi:hypothetical protein
MPKFRVPVTKIVTAYIVVEAEDEEKAAEISNDHLPEFCAQCQGWGAHGWSVDADSEWEPSDYEDIEPADDDEEAVNDH